jgi:phage-related protein
LTGLGFLGFQEDGMVIVLTNAFIKKSQKTPVGEIKLAKKRRSIS